MTQQHPITPPPELLNQWEDVWFDGRYSRLNFDVLIPEVFQAGADQELEACCALMDEWGLDGEDLMQCRRPKPPSLKEQALQALNDAIEMADYVPPEGICSDQADIIRRALESIPDPS